MNRKRVGIVVFPDVEVLDFCGPFEVFSVTRLDEERRREEPSPFDVFLVAEGPGPVVTTGGMKVVPDHTLESCPPLDILVVPGGRGARAEMKERATRGVDQGAREAGGDADVGLHRLDAARPGWPARRASRDHALARAPVDARVLLGGDGRGEAARRRGRPRADLGGHLGRHRHGAPRRRALSRRSDREEHGPQHGVPLPGRQRPPRLSCPLHCVRTATLVAPLTAPPWSLNRTNTRLFAGSNGTAMPSPG